MNLSSNKSTVLSIAVLLILVVGGLLFMKRENLLPLFEHRQGEQAIKLPNPILHSNVSIEEALEQRRSVREYKDQALTVQQVSQLLWAAQGVTAPDGSRTAPSVGGLYPLEIYVISSNVQNLAPGVYRYLPHKQSLQLITSSDKGKELAEILAKQGNAKLGPINLIITANYKKAVIKYGNRGEHFVHMEVGHAAENVYLQAVSLGLGTVAIGDFDETAVKSLLALPSEENLLYIMPVGKP